MVGKALPPYLMGNLENVEKALKCVTEAVFWF